MDRWRGRVALVTGASAGIGASIARALAEHGMKVVGCSPNTANIEKLREEINNKTGGGSVTVIPCDVSKEEEVLAMFEKIPNLGRVDVCINNAGLAHNAPILTGDTGVKEWRHMFEVNVLGLLMCTKESFKLMRENNIDDGHIILINSMSGIRQVKDKGGHCYNATKFAVTALREGIRNELRELNSGIRISQICPGIVETEFAAHHYDKAHAENVYSSIKCLQPDDIKDAVLYVLSAPLHVEINDVMMRPTQQVY
ncbi:hypothetical protein C0Q70_00948 [Pomacea canaliculata]|uniref:Dehydrogenase/reductase SDR family member 11 n=1 Tax=Pomacea canaliculata TaxID=400727 RepID=A0A2T7PY35_POMCA|nr:dehydrogenase/reductase SDR family member 11-like [Pomacea canaliculata]PVD38336.1 hypothetical protein C0Q70_00948 [Pomacea canaliculata]